ncbi:MAG: helix-turn-helix domain-containing protein [Bacteroidota bacterium]
MIEPTENEVIDAVVRGLVQLRNEKSLTQREVLYDTGIHIARIEARQKSITVYTLKRVCLYYGITLKDFFDKYCEGL